MGLQGDCSLDLDPCDIVIQREISRSEASSVLEVRICGNTRVMKLFHDIGDPGYSRRGRDLNRFRCELNAYCNLLKFGVLAEKLNCVNYSDGLFRYAVDGIREIHQALVHHHDIYPKNMLVVSSSKIVWIDFDVAMTFRDVDTRAKAYCENEVELVQSFGKLLRNDQLQGLPPNTSYY
ncbi:hypothetical protein BDV25DRAFT_127640 [Aspergillus avenaceus]|uniref:Protein kinase domain-containing protein n=1 Tax=Aspergillus avenaceus TaxID=36643 RepID=A0A5N6U2T2_ASPAV|nr:hypothetical protein BDV25DRAFT_127640 [Aspergillus avenaceus]